MAQTGITHVFLTVDVDKAWMASGHHFGEEFVDGLAGSVDFMVHFFDVDKEGVALDFAEGECHYAVGRSGEYCALEAEEAWGGEHLHHLLALNVGKRRF